MPSPSEALLFSSCNFIQQIGFYFLKSENQTSPRIVECNFSMGKFIPKEIITNILSRLPNESLWECKLVSKPWRDLIVYDKSFTHMHIQHRLHHDSSPDKVNFIFQLPVPDEFHIPEFIKKLYYAEFDKTSENFVRVRDLDLTHTEADHGIDYERLPNNPWGEEPWEIPYNDEIQHFEEIVGSCNGLVCITLSYNVREELFYKPLYVCNPMTRECVVLPTIPVPVDDEEDVDDSCHSDDDDIELWGGSFYDGFGYSPSTNEYKVVRIYMGEVYVYTLGDGKGWRHIGAKEERNKSGIGVYVHGAYNRLDKDRNLVSFDLEDEKFGVLPSPACFRDWDGYSYQLREDGECLSIIHESQRDVYDVWVLKKKELDVCETSKDEQDNQSWSWVKAYTLQDDRDASQKLNRKRLEPFAITKDREVLFHDDRFFYRHDLETRTSYPLMGFKKGSTRSIYSATRHVNSFVSLKALGERDTAKMILGDVVSKSLVPELTYNIEEEDKISLKKRKERMEDLYWPYGSGWRDDIC